MKKRMIKTLMIAALLPMVVMAHESDAGFAVEGGYRFNEGWKRYWPLATVEVQDGVLHIFNAAGEDGSQIYSKRSFAVIDGDIIKIALEAKGKGVAVVSAYRRGPNQEWIGAAGEKKLELTDEWTRFEFSVIMHNNGDKTLAGFEPVLGVEKNSEGYFRKVRVVRALNTTENGVFDNFETKELSRIGSPKLVKDYIAPGLLMDTTMGEYRTSTPMELLKTESVAFPDSEGRQFLRTGFRLYSLASQSRISAAFDSENTKAELAVEASKEIEALVCKLPDGRKFRMSNERLPADFFLSLTANGEWELEVKSLSDSSTRSISGELKTEKALGKVVRSLKLEPINNSAKAMARVDDLLFGIAEVARQKAVEFPYTAKPEMEFDPEKAGWKLVFEDEFEGTELNLEKWKYSDTYSKPKEYAFVKDGALNIKADFAPNSDGTKLTTGSVRTREKFLYGYFEARLKFTHESGWWAAFWLCENGISNSFINGFEIDIFEDYYTRILKPGESPHPHTIDHNLHTYVAGTLKSWNYNSTFAPEELGDAAFNEWHTIAAKWTPFEITYYFDGKAMMAKSKVAHSPYSTITFDAFRHSTATAPLSAIISGQIMKERYKWHDPRGFKFPELFQTDRVRIYAWPGSEQGVSPNTKLVMGGGDSFMVSAGAERKFTVEVERAKKSNAAIKAVHLFDNGCYLRTLNAPPYEFKVTMDDKYYNTTMWPHAGRQNIAPQLPGSMHVFAAFAEDELGNVGFSNTQSIMIAPPTGSSPRGGVAQKTPGTIVVSRYDEGGEGVGYHDANGIVGGTEHTVGGVIPEEWINYTIEVEKAGEYELTLPYGAPYGGGRGIIVLVDGREMATLEIKEHESRDWRCDCTAKASLKLKAGRQTLTLMLLSSCNFSDFTIE